MLRTRYLGVFVVTAGLMIGCSSKNENKLPDGGGSGSGSGSNNNCTSLALGTLERASGATAMSALWRGAVSTDLGGAAGSTADLQFEFYSGIEPSLVGSFDLTAGNQNNYATCATCVRVLEIDSMGAVVKQYFQDGGTLTLTADPLTSKHMTGTITDLSLVEVTVDPMTFTSTPVVGGVCLSLGTMTLASGPAPAAWTCAENAYEDGVTCDCACAAHDPDCDAAAAPVAGCATAQICGSADTCVSTCHVLPTSMGYTTGTCAFENATLDICYTDATLFSPVALGGTCAAGPTFCGVTNTIAKGICDSQGVDDSKCRNACAVNADCTAGTEVCQPIIGTRGLCVPKATNDTCALATPLALGTMVTGSTAGSTNDYDKGLEATTCTSYSQKGRDVAYSITLTAGTAYTVAVSGVSPDFDPSLALLGPGATSCSTTGSTNPSTCVKGADVGVKAEGETFAYTPTTTGIYYVVVDSFYARSGSFTLKVTSP
ncbi:hypothetical protein BH11MYX1_BH11MYX1_02430 [soil metagenome]